MVILMHKQYWVYMITNKTHSTLYVGMTNDLDRRMREHKFGEVEGFSKRYNLKILVYYEEYWDVRDAIAREKQLKKWNREWKERVINKENPKWMDLSAKWE